MRGSAFNRGMTSIFVLALLTAPSLEACGGPAYTPLTAPTTQTSPNAAHEETSATATSETGLSLTMSLTSTTYHPGEQVSVTIEEKNTLPKRNSVPVANKWPVQTPTLGPCGVLNYPFGISIMQGYHDAKSVSQATPLQLYDPHGTYSCSLILSGITSYDFQPASDIAAINTRDSAALLTMSMTSGLTAAGSWAGSPKATFSNFFPGTYTVVGTDEWGKLVTLHFVVS